MKNIKDELDEHIFFKDLDEEFKMMIAGCGRNVQFKAGEYIFHEGDPADEFFVIRKGSVAMEVHRPDGGALTIQTEGAGEVIGEGWLFPPYKSLLDARAIEAVRAVALDGRCLRSKCEDDPLLGYALMQRFAQILIERLHHAQIRLVDIYGN